VRIDLIFCSFPERRLEPGADERGELRIQGKIGGEHDVAVVRRRLNFLNCCYFMYKAAQLFTRRLQISRFYASRSPKKLHFKL
jgi:hypothetical protein